MFFSCLVSALESSSTFPFCLTSPMRDTQLELSLINISTVKAKSAINTRHEAEMFLCKYKLAGVEATGQAVVFDVFPAQLLQYTYQKSHKKKKSNMRVMNGRRSTSNETELTISIRCRNPFVGMMKGKIQRGQKRGFDILVSTFSE